MILTTIRRYPVKSCRGHDVAAALVEPWGLQGDRRWMLVEPDGAFVTAREVPELLRVRPTITEHGLRFEHERMSTIVVAKNLEAEPIDVVIWKSELMASLVSPEADDWFSSVIGYRVRLVQLDDPTSRPTNPQYSREGDRVSFADGYPVLLTSEASLAALNEQVDGSSMVMERFRPNVVIDGKIAWAEDDWQRVRIGPAEFRVVKRCDRCVMTTYDPTTIERGHEPIKTLASIHRIDSKVQFGVNLIPDNPGVTITVGDPVDVL